MTHTDGPPVEQGWSSPELLFWPGSLGSRGLDAIIEAAAAGGFTSATISPLMIHQLLSSGRSAADIVAQAQARGIRFTQLEGVSSWAPLWYQSDPLPWIKERFDFPAEHCLDLASAFGLDTILVAGAFDRGALGVDVLAEHFAAFCDAAAARNIRVERDANLTAVTEGLKFASFANNTENCQAHTRILAPRSRYEEVVAALKDLVESLKVGDPSDPATFIGPMVRANQQKRVQSYIRLGIEEGARLVTGGPEVPEGLESGFYVRPTLFADVDNSMRIAWEEIFGPVLVVIPYEDEEDAVRIANDSPYGLGGGVWTTDTERGLEIARRIRTGFFMVNAAPVGFDGPFGGYKSSGIGREMGAVGLTQFIEYKTINV
ncbi:aldehyde dehydrogenase family protein [Planotetraspora sp. GP83]|uniref:aldehyde dehydrogenase family protein n=1 Tax=Planotetraspora sp. GP83 TaxID=3156264 RepID=UPI003513EAC1